jgi:hypothetical protein
MTERLETVRRRRCEPSWRRRKGRITAPKRADAAAIATNVARIGMRFIVVVETPW